MRQPSPRMLTGAAVAVASAIGGRRGGELERAVVRRQRRPLAPAERVAQAVDGDVLLEDLPRRVAVERAPQAGGVSDRRHRERRAEDAAVQQQRVADTAPGGGGGGAPPPDGAPLGAAPPPTR